MSAADDPIARASRLERMFELSLDLLCIASTEGYFLRVNPAFERLLGYSKDELLKRRFIDFVHRDDRLKTKRCLAELARGQAVVDFKNRYRAKDGAWHWLAWRSSPPDEDGLVYAVARDITDEVEAHELIARQSRELARSNADLEEFAYAASHDLQAPLRAISHLVRWISEDVPSDAGEKVNRHLDELGAKVETMQQLVEDLLAYSRVGRVEEAPQAVDLNAMLEQIVDLIAPPEGFAVVAPADLPTLQADPTALQQVLRNLISNALAHHDADTGTVTLTAVERDREWEISVADDGPGIDPADIDRVFDRFVRLDPGTEGTGMGLALVKKTVERGGGKVGVQSEPGKGSTFTFTWPKSPHTAEPR